MFLLNLIGQNSKIFNQKPMNKNQLKYSSTWIANFKNDRRLFLRMQQHTTVSTLLRKQCEKFKAKTTKSLTFPFPVSV